MKEDGRTALKHLEHELAQARERVAELERQRHAPDSGKAMVNDVFEHHLDAVLYLDALTGDILWANLAATRLYGYGRDEFIRMHITDLNVMNRDEVLVPIRQVRERRRSRFVFTHRLKDGSLRNVEVYSIPMELEGREVLCSIIRDLTGLTDAETSAMKSVVLQDQVLSSMGIVPFSCRYKDNFELLYVGASVSVMTGFPPERFYADPRLWVSRIHSEDRDRVKGRFDRLASTGSTRCEYRWQVADGRWRWFTLSMRLVPCEDQPGCEPGANCLAGMFRDITDRKRTERALIDREERYRTVADFTHDWEFWIGPDGEFLYVSPSFERVTGYRPEELKRDASLLYNSIVHPLDREWVHTTLTDGLLSPDPLAFDFRIVTRVGDVRWLGHVSQAVYDDKGDPMGRRASNRDITELKETLRSLRDKNQFINSIMDNSPAAIFAKDVDGRYLFGNARFMKHAGKPPHEVLGKSDFGLFSNEEAERSRQSDQRVVETGKPLLEEIELLHNDRLEHWTSTKFPMVNAEGQVLGVCGISLDITEWREAEASLRRLTRAVEQSPVSIVMTDIGGHILSVNPYFCAISGYEESDILGRKLGFMLADEDELFYDPIWQTLRDGREWHGEIRNRTRTGDVLWEWVSLSPVRDGQGRITNFVAVKDDITERKRLERLEKDVERIVRHDLKSPIMSFIWVPRTLRKAANITEEQAVLLGELEQSAHRLLKMINLSLDIFKMEEGTYKFTPEDLNILRVVQNVLHDLSRNIETAKVRVDVRLDGRPVNGRECLAVRGEELLCHSMLSNLVGNALEASGPGSVITVDCESGERTTLKIHNDTPVPEAVRDTFFDKYSTAGKKFGTGLGTYSARLIAETQGGFIRMHSSEEQGTIVTVELPAGLSCSGLDAE